VGDNDNNCTVVPAFEWSCRTTLRARDAPIFATLRKGRVFIPARFVGDNNDFSFTAGILTRDVRL